MINMKYDFNNYAQHEKELGNDIRKNKSPPSFIKSNPYYWTYKIKTSLQEGYASFLSSLNPFSKRMIEQSTSGSSLEKRNDGIKTTLDVIKNTAVIIIEKINFVVKKITFDKVDLIKLSRALIKVETFGMIISKSISSAVQLSNTVNKYLIISKKKIFNYLEKYKDQSINSEFMKHNREMATRWEKYYKNQNKFLAKWIPSFTSTLKFIMQSNQINKVNKFLNMPRTIQKVYFIRNYFQDFVSKFRRIEKTQSLEKFSYESFVKKSKEIYSKKEALKPWNVYNHMRQNTKKFFFKVFVYMALFIFGIQSIKYIIYRIFNRNADRQLKEALDLINDLKKQNEELMKHNVDFMEKVAGKK